MNVIALETRWLIRLEVDHRVSWVERRFLLRKLFEFPQEVAVRHSPVVRLRPGNHSHKALPLLQPTADDLYRWTVVHYKNSLKFSSLLEVHFVVGSFVPPGEETDPTRTPAFYNDTYDYLTGLGVAEV
jgi:hypothetical protein